jgi:hypothetical protein
MLFEDFCLQIIGMCFMYNFLFLNGMMRQHCSVFFCLYFYDVFMACVFLIVNNRILNIIGDFL